MNTVEPIRDINTVWDIADYLGEKSERNKIMFLFGIYVGIRVSDILSLKVRDVRDMNYVSIREDENRKREIAFRLRKELMPLLIGNIKGKADYERCFHRDSKTKRYPDVRRTIYYQLPGRSLGCSTSERIP